MVSKKNMEKITTLSDKMLLDNLLIIVLSLNFRIKDVLQITNLFFNSTSTTNKNRFILKEVLDSKVF